MEKQLLPPSHFFPPNEEDVNFLDTASDLDFQAKLTALNVFSKDFLDKQSSKQVFTPRIDCENNKQEESSYKSPPNRFKEIERLRNENEFLQKILNDQKSRCGLKENSIKNGQSQVELLQENVSILTTALLKKDNDITILNCQLEKLNVETKALTRLCDDRLSENQNLTEEVVKKDYEMNQVIANSDADKTRILSEFESTKSHIIKLWMLKCEGLEENVKKHEEDRNEVEEKNKQSTNELQQQHSTEIEELKASYETKLKMMKEENCDISKQLCNQNETLQSQFQTLQDDIGRTRTELEDEHSKSNKLRSELAEKHECMESIKIKLEQEQKNMLNLRAYVSDVQKDDLDRANWKRERESLCTEVESLENKAIELTKTLELQAIRFKSIKKILETQEDKIHTQSKAVPSGDFAHPEHMIIRKWREKVFELMVQVKSQELLSRDISSKYQLSENDLKLKLQDCERDCVILRSQVAETNAELELKQNKVSVTNSHNAKLNQEVDELRQKVAGYDKTFAAVREAVKSQMSSMETSFSETMAAILSKNSRLEQRILFATNRLRTIHDLTTRKTKVKHAKFMKKFREASTSTDDMQADNSDNLMLEIQKMVAERDKLSSKLKDDAALFENAVSDFQNQIKAMEATIKTLQQQFDDKVEDCNELTNQIEKLQQSLQNAESKLSVVEEKYSALKIKFEGNVEAILNDNQNLWNAEKLDLQAQLNDAKSEVAKGLIVQRQAQRSFARDLKAATEDLQTTVDANQRDMKVLNKKIKQYEQDNNLLMTTLRQEGLIAAYKANRTHYKNSLKELKQKSEFAKSKQFENATSRQNAHVDESAKSSPMERRCNSVNSPERSEINLSNEDINMQVMLKELVAMTDDVLNAGCGDAGQ